MRPDLVVCGSIGIKAGSYTFVFSYIFEFEEFDLVEIGEGGGRGGTEYDIGGGSGREGDWLLDLFIVMYFSVLLRFSFASPPGTKLPFGRTPYASIILTGIVAFR